MQANAAVKLRDGDNEALQWLQLRRSGPKMMPRRHHQRSNEHFQLCWSTTRATLLLFLNKYQNRSLDLYPRQQFVREQVQLLVGDYIEKMDNRQFTAIRFREGVENLYYLTEALRTKDQPAQNMLSYALSEIVLACGDLVEYYEVVETGYVTDWQLVSVALKERIVRHNYRSRCGKLQDFTLGNMIGVGGFGVVFKAKLGRIPCVLKFVPPDVLPSADQALVDKEVASMISHPCLVAYYATFVIQEAFVTCMEFVEGVALVRVIHKSQGGLPPQLVKIIIGQLGLAVQHLHFKGFIHRDVKPENIMIAPSCRIKLIDFDTCKVSAGKYSPTAQPAFREKTAKEFPGAPLAGTIPYMAPEALMKTGLGRAVDWWSVGVTTYHVSTGRLPFKGYAVDEVLQQVVVPSYTWPPTRNWSTDLLQFVADCLNPDPYTRLCSEYYWHFQTHQYFRGLDFQLLETESWLGAYPLIDVLMERHPAVDQQHLSAGAHARRDRLFPTMSFHESPNPSNCYCYSSPGFVNCLRYIEAGYVPSVKDIAGSQESIDVFDDETASYVFESFLKDPEDGYQESYERPRNPYERHRTGTTYRTSAYYQSNTMRAQKKVPRFHKHRK